MLAVKHCHNNGVIHRDIKPENIILSQEGKVTLIDFGLAKYKEEKDSDLVGTSFYMAPEMIRGDYDERCDVWSVGAVAFTILTSFVPFGGNERKSTFRKIMHAPICFPKSAKLSIQARDLIRRLLDKDVENRITIEKALQHGFLAEKDETTEIKQDNNEDEVRRLPGSTRVSSEMLNELGEQSVRFSRYL